MPASNFCGNAIIAGATDIDSAIEKAKTAFAEVGFGTLFDLDIGAKFKAKVGIEDQKPFHILGVCNPKLAHDLLVDSPGAAVILPCRCAIWIDESNKANIAVTDPASVLGSLKATDTIQRVSKDAGDKVNSVLKNLGGDSACLARSNYSGFTVGTSDGDSFNTVHRADFPTGVTFEEAIEKTKTVLPGNKFGTVSEIDASSVFKAKLGIEDFPSLRLMGICNPKVAYQMTNAYPFIASLLPCGAAVRQKSDGGFELIMISADSMVSNMIPDLKTDEQKEMFRGAAKEVNETLKKILAEATK